MALILSLLEQSTTIDRVRDFLQKQELPHSAGSWQEIKESRIGPALKDGTLGHDKLLDFLRDSEEHGRQHVFLYRCEDLSVVQAAMNRSRVMAQLRDRGLERVATHPRILDKPRSPSIADVRWSPSRSLVIKVVETRAYSRKVDETREGNRLTLVYETFDARAVSLFALHADGTLELRIQSHKNTSKYDEYVKQMWQLVAGLLNRNDFTSVPLVNAKTALWLKRESLRDRIKFSDLTLRDNDGLVVSAATRDAEVNLTEAPAAVNCVNTFLSDGTRSRSTYCERSNVWFVRSSSRPLPSRDVHVLLSGTENEFAVTGSCSGADYGYVLEQIREHNS